MTPPWQGGVRPVGPNQDVIGTRDGTTNVVLSFGARGGGALFAQWLRLTVMQRKGYTRQREVFLDTIALQSVGGTTLKMLTRDRPTAGGMASINDAWNSYYTAAMSQAHTMIFVATLEWWQSPNCSIELSQFRTENVARRKSGRKPLNGIVLRFPDFPGGGFQGMKEIIETDRLWSVADPVKRAALTGNMRDQWTVDEATVSRLIAAIG